MDRRIGLRFDPPMTNDKGLTVIATVGAAASGGVFLAFSTFVMKALGRLPPAQGMAAMQSINTAAPNPVFMATLFGTAVVGIGLSVGALRRTGETGDVYVLVGTGLYLVAIGLTVAYHVPRNNALEVLDPHAAGSADAWSRYLGGWTAWNHVRTATSLGGAVAFALALRSSK